MSMAPSVDENDAAERDAERQAAAMKDQLRKDVASWSSARHDSSARHIAEHGAPITPPPAVRTVRKPKATKPAAPKAAPAQKDKKPFRMSYGGTTTADYVRYMLERGGR